MRELVEAGSPDVSYLDTEKRSPLHLAAYRGSREVVEILIVQVAGTGTTTITSSTTSTSSTREVPG